MTEPDASWVHSFEQDVDGDCEEVFAALTSPAQLRRWFAQHVRVEPRRGGAYAFWGRNTWGAPGRAAPDQRITRFQPGRILAYSWTFDEVPSEVTLQLAPAGSGATCIGLSHRFAAPLPGPYPAELVDDLWRLTLGNLSAHLKGGAGIVLPDFADPNPEVRASIVIDAPRARVFRALLEPERLNQWMATGATVEPHVGGRYTHGWTYPVGDRQVQGGASHILELVPNERLVTDWLDWRGDATRGVSRVAWVLEDHGAGTRVTLVHHGFGRTADLSDYPFGWPDFLSRLKVHAEAAA